MRKNTVLIVVSKGTFDTVERAARSEKRVKWFVPDPDADAVTECYAAIELKQGMAQLLAHARPGRATAIGFAAPEEKDSKPDLRIILGTPRSNRLIRRMHMHGDLKNLKNDEGYLILADEDSAVKTVTIAAQTRKGVLNGVYGYLEKLGMRWTSPDQPQASWPRRVLLWQEGWRIEASPCFELRGYVGSGGKAPQKPLVWMARNRMNFGGPGTSCPELAKKLGLALVGGGHVFEDIFDPDREIKKGVKLYDAHPDWFAFRNGERVRAKGHACMSHPDAVRFLLDNAVDLVTRDASRLDIYRFWPPDVWASWCECKNCRTRGNDADRYLALVHELRRRLDGKYAKGKIDHRIVLFFIVYEGSGIYPPPTRPFPIGFDMKMNQMEVWPINRCYAHRQADPECREFNRHYWCDLKGWLKVFKGKKVMGEYYNVSQYWDMATVFSQVMYADVQDYLDAGFTGLQYMHAAPGHWGPRSLTNWQLGRLQWNARQDYDAMLREFFTARFGPVAGEAGKLYALLDKAMSNLSTIKNWLEGSVSYRLQHIYGNSMKDYTTEQLFVYDHLKLHRAAGSDGTVGYGFDNFDDIMKALRTVRAGLANLRQRRNLDRVTKANLDEDIWQMDYTNGFLGLHHEFALYWEANRYGTGRPNLIRRRILATARRLAAIEVPEPALPPSGDRDSSNALCRTALAGPLRKVFGFERST